MTVGSARRGPIRGRERGSLTLMERKVEEERKLGLSGEEGGGGGGGGGIG